MARASIICNALADIFLQSFAKGWLHKTIKTFEENVDNQEVDQAIEALIRQLNKELPSFVTYTNVNIEFHHEKAYEVFLSFYQSFMVQFITTYIDQETLSTARLEAKNKPPTITDEENALSPILQKILGLTAAKVNEILVPAMECFPEKYKERCNYDASRTVLELIVATFVGMPFLDNYTRTKIKESFISFFIKEYKKYLQQSFNLQTQSNTIFTWTDEKKIELYKYYQDLSPKWIQAHKQAKTLLSNKLTAKDWKKSLETIEAFEDLFEHEDLIDRLPGTKLNSPDQTKKITSGIKAIILEHTARLCGAPHWAYQATTLDKNRKQGQTMWNKLKENSRISSND